MRVSVQSDGIAETVTVSRSQLEWLLETQRIQQENQAHREYRANETQKANIQTFMLAFKK